MSLTDKLQDRNKSHDGIEITTSCWKVLRTKHIINVIILYYISFITNLIRIDTADITICSWWEFLVQRWDTSCWEIHNRAVSLEMEEPISFGQWSKMSNNSTNRVTICTKISYVSETEIKILLITLSKRLIAIFARYCKILYETYFTYSYRIDFEIYYRTAIHQNVDYNKIVIIIDYDQNWD